MLVESAVLLLSFAPTPKVDERGASTGPSKTSYSSAGGSTCSDGFVDVLIGADKKPWKDSGGDGCAAYKSNFWSCDARGYDKDGHSAKTACCHCGGGKGGGTKCTDKQDWVDSAGDDCETYERYNWCPQFEDFGRPNTVKPKEACCVCGGGTKIESAAELKEA